MQCTVVISDLVYIVKIIIATKTSSARGLLYSPVVCSTICYRHMLTSSNSLRDDNVNFSYMQTAMECTLLHTLEPLCSISYKVNCPISSDIGWLDEQTGYKFVIMGAWCMIYNKFLIELVAVQYH